MGSPSPAQVLKVKGRLCVNPNNLAAAFPHGGTALGQMTGGSFTPSIEYRENTSEEDGGSMVDAIAAGHRGRFVAILAAWDRDAVVSTFINATSGSVTSRPVWSQNARTDSVRAGVLASVNAASLYFSPDAKQHPGLLIYRAIPMSEPQGSMAFSLAARFGVPMVWRAVPNEDGEVWQVGLREDLTL